jgi:HD superfamily phosphodiesterase
MKAIFQKILLLARPYLDTRKNHIHTEISTKLAYRLLAGEGGNKNIVIPAIILHDIGWKAVPESLQLKAFGPKAMSPELNRKHEIAGVKTAREILEKVNYDPAEIKQILEIIDGHDSRKQAVSLDDKIVKDADKLFRYTKEGLFINTNRFNEAIEEAVSRYRSNIDKWFFTDSAKRIAKEELERCSSVSNSQAVI